MGNRVAQHGSNLMRQRGVFLCAESVCELGGACTLAQRWGGGGGGGGV